MTIKNLDYGTVLNAAAYFPNLWYEKIDYSNPTYDAAMCVWIPDQSPLNRDKYRDDTEEVKKFMVYPQKTKEYTLTYNDQYVVQSYGNIISYSLFCDKLLNKDSNTFIGVSPNMQQKPFRLELKLGKDEKSKTKTRGLYIE